MLGSGTTAVSVMVKFAPTKNPRAVVLAISSSMVEPGNDVLRQGRRTTRPVAEEEGIRATVGVDTGALLETTVPLTSSDHELSRPASNAAAHTLPEMVTVPVFGLVQR